MAYAAPVFTKLESSLQHYVDKLISNFTHTGQQICNVQIDNHLHPQQSVCHWENFYEIRLTNLRNSYTEFHDNPSNNLKHKIFSQAQLTYLIQISTYLIQINYMFQPHMVIFRLAHKEKNEYTVAFDIEISDPYVNICIQYIHTKLDSLSMDVRKSCSV